MKKLDLDKKREDKLKGAIIPSLQFYSPEQVELLDGIKRSIDDLFVALNGKQEFNFDLLYEQMKFISEHLNFKPITKSLEESTKKAIEHSTTQNISVHKTQSDGFSKLLEAIKSIANNKPVVNIDLTKLEKAIIQVQQTIQENAADPRQAPDEYTPVRRVIKVGNKLIYDDSVATGGRGGGGASSSTTSLVQGTVANDDPDSGNPVKIGAIARTSLPTAVANNDRVDAYASKTGAIIVHQALREQLGNQQTTITSSTAETTIVTADATYLLDLYGLIITNTSTTFTKVTIKDATTGTTRMVIAVPATETRGFMVSPDAGHKQATVNNNWTATCGTSVASIEITAMFNKR
jgi:hypothetical protein